MIELREISNKNYGLFFSATLSLRAAQEKLLCLQRQVSLTAKGEGTPRVTDRTSTILDKQESWVVAKTDEEEGRKEIHTLGSGETHAPWASHVFSKPLAVQTAVSLSPNKEARVQMCGYLLCQLPNSMWAFINPVYLKTCVTLEALRVGIQSEVFFFYQKLFLTEI